MLRAKARNIFGKKLNSVRKRGELPAILYGQGVSNLPLFVNRSEFKKVWEKAGETTLIRLFLEDEKDPHNVLIHDVALDPVNAEFYHIDFYQVRLDQKIMARVPLVWVGDSPAVIDEGGVLVKALQELEVRALPQDLPHEIVADISSLKTFEDVIFVKDVRVPNGVEVIENPEVIVASVVPPRTEEELKSLEEKVVESVEGVKAETEERKEAREERLVPGSAQAPVEDQQKTE